MTALTAQIDDQRKVVLRFLRGPNKVADFGSLTSTCVDHPEMIGSKPIDRIRPGPNPFKTRKTRDSEKRSSSPPVATLWQAHHCTRESSTSERMDS